MLLSSLLLRGLTPSENVYSLTPVKKNPLTYPDGSVDASASFYKLHGYFVAVYQNTEQV